MPRTTFCWPFSKGHLVTASICLLFALVPASVAAGRPGQAVIDRGTYDYGSDTNAHLVRHSLIARQSSDAPFVVTGAPVGNSTSMPVRQEIRKMQLDSDLWTLYLLGLNFMQYTDQTKLLSYYQIAGIHGVPWISWNGVPAVGKESLNTGYCTHRSELFLPWHRPYLALYEQVLYSIIQTIASLYNTDKIRYQNAAKRFRIPYMDWAAQPPAGQSVLPDVLAQPIVSVSGPNGVQNISNPLYTYLFKPLNASIFIEDPYDKWLTTVRAPTAQGSSAGSNNTKVSLALNAQFTSIQQRLYNVFSHYHDFSAFSNEAYIADQATSGSHDSLESIHDTIHGLIGLDGHMSWIPFSAFDPIFFLHHCMIDRIFALWQARNPLSWVNSTKALSPTYTIYSGQTVDSKTPLAPFHKDAEGSFWTSDDVRDMGVFGYTYDDMVDLPRSSLTSVNEDAQQKVNALVNKLYGTSSPAMLKISGSTKGERQELSIHNEHQYSISKHDFTPVARASQNNDPQTLKEPPSPPTSVISDNKYYEWVANIRCARQALSGTFFVHIFMGSLPVDHSAWALADNLVGTISIFSSPFGAMDNTETSGTVPLTSAMNQEVRKGRLARMDPSTAAPYLRHKLHVGVIMTNGTVVDPKNVNGLNITIVSSSVKVPTSSKELPKWGNVEDQFDLTSILSL